MQILVNDQPQAIAPGTSISALLDQLDLGQRRVAVERNGEIVPRSAHADTVLADGDRLLIVQAIGGG